MNQTKSTSNWDNQLKGTTGRLSFLLLESGFNLLLESGDKFISEALPALNQTKSTSNWSNQLKS